MTEKSTPTQCKELTCIYNILPPNENDQECISCEGLKETNQQPTQTKETPQ